MSALLARSTASGVMSLKVAFATAHVWEVMSKLNVRVTRVSGPPSGSATMSGTTSCVRLGAAARVTIHMWPVVSRTVASVRRVDGETSLQVSCGGGGPESVTPVSGPAS